MKYKTAMAAVFAKYGSPRARTHAVSLLERYSSATRPVTAWNALGEDADAARLLLEGLGFSEKEHFTVQRSVLDPSATRFSWTSSGTGLVARMTSELAGVDFVKVQRRVVLGSPDPLDPLPDVEPGDAEAEADADDFVELVLDRTRDVAARLAAARKTCTDLAADTYICAWADKVLAGNGDAAPVAPLAALEALARVERLGGLPEFRVFSPVFHDGWQASRPVTSSENVVPAGSVNCLPLAEQLCADYGGLAGYVAWTIDTWRKSPRGRRAVWTQFDAKIAETPQAVNFALDAERMRAFVQAIVENGYRRFGCCLVPTTRVGVHNLALDGKVPGSEDLVNEDGEATQVQCRIENSSLTSSTVLYMGAHVMSPHPAPEQRWTCATHPVQVVSSAGEASDEKSAANEGITTGELAEEWFLMTHEGPHSIPGGRPDASASLAAFRVTARLLRESPARIAAMCMPSNPSFAANDCGAFTTPGTLLNGICAAMRKYGRDGLVFVADSPYSPDMFVAGVWSGLATDLAPTSADEARDAGVFPNFGGARSFQSGYADTDRAAMTDFLALMRKNPHVQLKFGKRTKDTHRRHVIVIETNVDAKRFLGGLGADAARQLRQAAWQVFYTSMLAGRFNPLDAVDAAFSAYSTYNATLYRLGTAVAKTVSDWSVCMRDSEFPAKAPTSFGFGWREDSLGRLVVVVSTEAPLMALRAKLMYRHLAGLPLASARYLAMHGQADAAVLTPDMTPGQGFAEVIRAAVRQTGFDAHLSRTNGSFGRFGPIWSMDALWDLDEDEIPDRDWYNVDLASNNERAGQYIGDVPF